MSRDKLLYQATLRYDDMNHLALFGERVRGADKLVEKQENGKNYVVEDDDGTDNITTRYQYDADDRTTKVIYDDPETDCRSVSYTYDEVGRIGTRTVENGEGLLLKAEYGYEDNAATSVYGKNSTTTLVTSIAHPQMRNLEFFYTYDNVGNIASEVRKLRDESKNRHEARYRYDPLGQLIRVDDLSDLTCGDGGTTWTYEYDLGGNITKKRCYPMTEGELPANPVDEIVYQYGNTSWRDQLTNYNGSALAYDAIGNPLSYGNWAYEWEKGRQLKKMTHKTAADGPTDKVLEFSYNAEGLRVQKKLTEPLAENGPKVTTTDYFLHGKMVMHLKQIVTLNGEQQGDPQELHFYYDAQSRPSMVKYGSGYDAPYYTYLHSLQGDIVGIVDKYGDMVVEYGWDAWGRPTFMRTLTEAYDELAALNPFRYRGYLYDEDAGLYYLRSRYYSEMWGRFINVDDLDTIIVLDDADDDMLHNNPFAYCGNNPIHRIDIAGKWWQLALEGVGAGGGLFAVLTTALSVVTPIAIVAVVVVVAVAVAAAVMYAKGHQGNMRDTGLRDMTDQEIADRLKDPAISAEEKRRLQREQKARGDRNKRKRDGYKRG